MLTSTGSNMNSDSSLRNVKQHIKIILKFKTALYSSALVMKLLESCLKPKLLL